MRKRYLASISLAAIIGGATLASAQTTSSSPTPVTTTAPVPERQAMHPRWHRHRLFRGVGLTADQRAKLSTMREQYRAQAKPFVSQMRATHADLRAARWRGDTAGVAAAKAKMNDTRAHLRRMRDRWLNDARGVLTPVQQTRFDRNVARIKTARDRHRRHPTA